MMGFVGVSHIVFQNILCLILRMTSCTIVSINKDCRKCFKNFPAVFILYNLIYAVSVPLVDGITPLMRSSYETAMRRARPKALKIVSA